MKFNGKPYTGTLTASYKITQASQEITTAVNSKTLKYSAVKSQSATFYLKGSAQTELTYKSNNAKVKVSQKGKVVVTKGTPKGTYKITITAEESDLYEKETKVIKIYVK